MNKFLSMCAISGLFVLSNGCTPPSNSDPCAKAPNDSNDGRDCQRIDYSLVASKEVLSFNSGDMVTVSVPAGQAPSGLNYQTAPDLYVTLAHIGSDNKINKVVIPGGFDLAVAKRPNEIDLALSNTITQGLGKGTVRIQVYANGVWSHIDLRIE